jgi:hypothetical protein
MKSCVDTFSKGLNDLVLFLGNADRETELVKGLLTNDRSQSLTMTEKELLAEISEAATDKKRYVYAIAIVGLYGLLERLVDDILEKYVVIISALVDRYDDLPETIRKNHITLSIDLMKAVSEERHRSDLTAPQIIGNLHSCLSGADSFRLNGQAFVLHRGNIRLARVREFLGKLGIDASLRRILVMPTLEKFFADGDQARITRDVPDADSELLLAPIDELVERRNLVAHGIIDDIETVDLLKDRCRFVCAFAHSLLELLQQEVLRIEISRGSVQALGRPIAVFDNRIACFESEKCKIAVGDRIVAATEDALVPFRWSQVINIEVDRTRHPALDITTRTQFGVEVGFTALKNHDYFLLPGKP